MAPPLLTLKDVHLTIGRAPLLDGAELSVAPGECICLVGRNGSGKSTLLKIAAGLVDPDRGERFAHPDARICYLPQEADFTGYTTVLDYVAGGLGPADNPYEASRLIDDLGIAPDADPQTLSGGEARRAALARVLAASPDVMLLDEPTNHLDLPAITWLEDALRASRGAIVLISHDRRFLETLSRATIWLDRGIARRLEQGFSAFEEWRDRTLEEEETERHKLDRKIAREDQWMHGGVTARRKRNVRRVAELKAMRAERKAQRKAVGTVRMAAADAELSGKLVIEATGISKSYSGIPVVTDLSLRVMRGDRLGIVGPNGAGKTTLLRLLTGELAPDGGEVRLGTNLVTVVMDQKREDLDPNETVAHALTGGRGDHVVINGQARHVASYMKDFLFQPEQARSPFRVLSGGERARLMLARALAKPSNLLILDEPTNDLDLETLDLLQELLTDYAGTLILVSHDRDFLDRIVTSVLAPDGDGRWIEYAGGYSDMMAQRRGEAPAKTDREAGAKERVRSGAEQRVATPPPQAKTAAPSRKLSFKEKHALETLPGRMEVLQKSIAGLQKELDDPRLYARSPDRFAAASDELASAMAELAAAEDAWLELELKRAELED